MILFLGLLNPLMCLIYCASQPATHDAAQSSSIAHYICRLTSGPPAPPASIADQPIPVAPAGIAATGAMPQAVYASILSPALMSLSLPMRPFMLHDGWKMRLLRHDPPPFPPPERAES